jgi:hypothetical protein
MVVFPKGAGLSLLWMQKACQLKSIIESTQFVKHPLSSVKFLDRNIGTACPYAEAPVLHDVKIADKEVPWLRRGTRATALQRTGLHPI